MSNWTVVKILNLDSHVAVVRNISNVVENKCLPLFYKGKLVISKWGAIWGSNPCITEPQSAVLTTSPMPPYVFIFYQ